MMSGGLHISAWITSSAELNTIEGDSVGEGMLLRDDAVPGRLLDELFVCLGGDGTLKVP